MSPHDEMMSPDSKDRFSRRLASVLTACGVTSHTAIKSPAMKKKLERNFRIPIHSFSFDHFPRGPEKNEIDLPQLTSYATERAKHWVRELTVLCNP